jgi:hypothetical protein
LNFQDRIKAREKNKRDKIRKGKSQVNPAYKYDPKFKHPKDSTKKTLLISTFGKAAR